MELLLNASQVLLFRKIISLFRQITQSLHIISTEEGLELSALNSSNTAWLHVFFAQSFFVSYRTINKLSKKELKTLISAKNFYNSLTSVGHDIFPQITILTLNLTILAVK